jgi:hypothetical protein
VNRHSKTPTSSALAREPRRRLLAARVRDCSRPRLAYSERTPSVPRCQYPGERLPAGLREDSAGGEPPALVSEHDADPGETYRLAIACSIWSISIVVGGICWKRKSAIA